MEILQVMFPVIEAGLTMNYFIVGRETKKKKCETEKCSKKDFEIFFSENNTK